MKKLFKNNLCEPLRPRRLISLFVIILFLGMGIGLSGQGLSRVWAEQKAHHPEHSPHASAEHGEKEAHGAHGSEHGSGHEAEKHTEAHGDSHGSGHGEAHDDGHGEAHGDGHGEAHGDGHGEHHEPPFSYYLHWLVIFLILIPVVLGLHQQRAAAAEHAPHEEAHGHDNHNEETHGHDDHHEEAHGHDDHDEEAHGHDDHHDEGGHGGHHAPPPAGIPLLVIILVAFMFYLENFSAMAHYHQSVGTGFVQFAVKMVTGAFTMLYGLGFKH